MHERFSEMAARLFPPIVKRDAVPEAELKRAEKRLGFALPASLRAMYRLSGRRRDLHLAHDRLRDPNKLIFVHGALVFYEDNLGGVAWGVAKDALEEEDPPVLRAKNEPPFEWEADHDALSAFFFTELLWQHVNTEPFARLEEGARAAIEASFEAIELEGCHWSIEAWIKGTVVAIARADAIYVGARSSEELEEATAAIKS